MACQPTEKPTTFIIVRHAEKILDDSKDPDLTGAGYARAERLAKLISNAELDAVYSTPFVRTEKTVAPTANHHQLTIANYDPADYTTFLSDLLDQYQGQTVLISGHSNTVPTMVNLLCSTELGDFEENEYGNIMVVTASQLGSGELLRLHY